MRPQVLICQACWHFGFGVFSFCPICQPYPVRTGQRWSCVAVSDRGGSEFLEIEGEHYTASTLAGKCSTQHILFGLETFTKTDGPDGSVWTNRHGCAQAANLPVYRMHGLIITLLLTIFCSPSFIQPSHSLIPSSSFVLNDTNSLCH